MSHKKRTNRRQFLRGAGGFGLAVPFLPSLASRAFAAPPEEAPQERFFVAMATQHGGIWTSNMYPAENGLTHVQNYAGREVRRGALSLQQNGDFSQLSSVLRASSTALTPSLVNKMNVIRGLDIPFYIAHHRGGHLGNYAANDGNGQDGLVAQNQAIATIDQLMAWSPAFYSDLSTIKERSLHLGGHEMSWTWADPSQKAGQVIAMPATMSSHLLFQKLFVLPGEPADPRPPVVDRVFEAYQSLRHGNKRLSSLDRARLDAHMERLDELQRRINITLSCGDMPLADSQMLIEQSDYPIAPDAQGQAWGLLNEIVALAFSCGATRIATLQDVDTHNDFVGDWHQDVAHQGHLPNGVAQQRLVDGHQRFFEDVFLDLANRLDSIDDGNGGTLLDRSYVQWTQESGNLTHDATSIPIITAGSACGAFNTGNYCDYRDWTLQAPPCPECPGDWEGFLDAIQAPGLIYNQYLHTVLGAMGVPASDYAALDGVAGYGIDFVGPEYDANYPNAVRSARNEPLPFLV